MSNTPQQPVPKKPAIVLPKTKVLATAKSPGLLIIASKPKIGKSSNLAGLDNNLILDLEKSTKFIDALKIEATSVSDIFSIGKQIIADNKPYDYVTVDTMTALEDMCIPYAEKIYSETSQGKKWFMLDSDGKLSPNSGKAQYGSIINIPNGFGYPYLRQAVSKVINYVQTWAPRVILTVHVKDIVLEKAGAEFSVNDLDLTGKIKRILASQADAIGYLYRKKNQNILTFVTSDEFASAGARPEHLSNKEILLSEKLPDGTIKTHWDRIFID